ncbi:MAG: hypothetical protein RJB66_1703 [Pseudomonadota bacterium]
MQFLGSIIDEIKELYRYRWVTHSFVKSTLLLRYRRSLLGFFWSLLNPILNYIVVGFVFYMLSRGSTPNYFIYMFTGSAIFNLISVTTNGSTTIMLANEQYIKKIYLPKSIFIFNAILFEAVNFMFSITALLILGLLFGQLELSWSLLSVPMVIFFVILMNFGIAAFLSVTTVFFRDFIHITPILTQAAFFATPILYSLDLVPEKYQALMKLNPFFHVVKCFREPFYSGQLAGPVNYAVLGIGSVVVFLFGFWVLKRNENRIVFRL